MAGSPVRSSRSASSTPSPTASAVATSCSFIQRRASTFATGRTPSASAIAATPATAGMIPSSGIERAVQDADREQRPAEREEADVGEAREQEEGDRAAGDVGGGQPAAAQDPRAEREPARAADREHGVGGQLGQPDLGCSCASSCAGRRRARNTST